MHVMSNVFGDELYLRKKSKRFELKQISKLVNPYLGKAPTPEKSQRKLGTQRAQEQI